MSWRRRVRQPVTRVLVGCLCWLAPLAALAGDLSSPARFEFEVTFNKELSAPAKDGRLFVVLARTNNPEPRFTLGRTGLDAPEALARDVKGFAPGATVSVDQTAFAFPLTNLSALARRRLLRPGAVRLQ